MSGPKRWDVAPSREYTERLEQRAPSRPRLHEVLDGIWFELERAPFKTDRCSPVESGSKNKVWVIESEPEADVPAVVVIFSIWNQRITVEDFDVLDDWIDQVLSGEADAE